MFTLSRNKYWGCHLPLKHPAEQTDQGINAAHTHSFIIKIWLEETTEEAGYPMWRGHITRVPGGERRYLKELDDIKQFIKPHIEAMGVKSGLRWRISRWLNR
jgi:hypothetical protein